MRLGRSLKSLSVSDLKTVMMPVVPQSSDSNRAVAKEPAASELWESLR